MGYLYIYPIIQLPHAAVTGLLLWARRLGDIDSIVARPGPSAAYASSVTLSADVGC